MKRLLFIVLMITTFTLTGCVSDGDEVDAILDYESCYQNDGLIRLTEADVVCHIGDISQTYDYPDYVEILEGQKDNYYTKEEVDIMNERFGEMLDQLNHKFWDYYTTEELDEGFEDVIIRFEALELEATPEVQEVYITIAMLNVLIFMYDEDVANGAVFPDSDVEYYEMLKVMRDEYRATLTD